MLNNLGATILDEDDQWKNLLELEIIGEEDVVNII